MKKIILALLVRKGRQLSPSAFGKLKSLLLAAFFVVLTTGALAVWGGIALARYASNEIAPVFKDPRPQISGLQQSIEKIDLTKVNLYSCWSQAQSLLTPTPWMTAPVAANWARLKSACMNSEVQTRGAQI